MRAAPPKLPAELLACLLNGIEGVSDST